MNSIDDRRAAVITAARSHHPTTVQAYAPACVDMECGHDPYGECPLVDVEVCAACTAVSEDRDPEEWLLVAADCPVCLAVVELEAAEAIVEQWRAARAESPFLTNLPTEREIVDRLTGGRGRIEIPVPPPRRPTAPNPMIMEKQPRSPRAWPSYEAVSLIWIAFAVMMVALILAVKL